METNLQNQEKLGNKHKIMKKKDNVIKNIFLKSINFFNLYN